MFYVTLAWFCNGTRGGGVSGAWTYQIPKSTVHMRAVWLRPQMTQSQWCEINRTEIMHAIICPKKLRDYNDLLSLTITHTITLSDLYSLCLAGVSYAFIPLCWPNLTCLRQGKRTKLWYWLPLCHSDGTDDVDKHHHNTLDLLDGTIREHQKSSFVKY